MISSAIPKGELRDRAGGDLSRQPRRNPTPPIRRLGGGDCVRQKEGPVHLLPPKHIFETSPTKLMKSEGYGSGYGVRPRQPRTRLIFRPGLFPGSAGPPRLFMIPPDRGFERERSASGGWITGRSCGRSGAERIAQLVPRNLLVSRTRRGTQCCGAEPGTHGVCPKIGPTAQRVAPP